MDNELATIKMFCTNVDPMNKRQTNKTKQNKTKQNKTKTSKQTLPALSSNMSNEITLLRKK